MRFVILIFAVSIASSFSFAEGGGASSGRGGNTQDLGGGASGGRGGRIPELGGGASGGRGSKTALPDINDIDAAKISQGGGASGVIIADAKPTSLPLNGVQVEKVKHILWLSLEKYPLTCTMDDDRVGGLDSMFYQYASAFLATTNKGRIDFKGADSVLVLKSDDGLSEARVRAKDGKTVTSVEFREVGRTFSKEVKGDLLAPMKSLNQKPQPGEVFIQAHPYFFTPGSHTICK